MAGECLKCDGNCLTCILAAVATKCISCFTITDYITFNSATATTASDPGTCSINCTDAGFTKNYKIGENWGLPTDGSVAKPHFGTNTVI